MDSTQQQLVNDNIALARFLARKSWEKASHALDLDELTSLAFQGLVSAALRYRTYGEEHGFSEESIASGQYFAVFARRRIIGSMIDSMRDDDHVTRNSRHDYKLLQSAGYSGSFKDIQELVRRTGLTENRIRKVCRLVEMPPVSTDQQDPETVEQHESPHDVEASALEKAFLYSLGSYRSHLSDFQQTIVALRYFEEMEIKVIATELGEPLGDVRDAHFAAVVSIRELLHHSIKDAS